MDSMGAPPDRQVDLTITATLEQRKRASALQLLLRCARRVDEQAVARIRAASGRPVRTAHTALLPHIDLDGTRVTEIARRLGVTKQAVAPLVDELVAWGVLEKVADPADARARRVRFAGGGAALLPGLDVLQAFEQELAGTLGEAWPAELRDLLLRLDAALDRP